MKKQHLLKSMLLLCALVVGSGSVWADKIKKTVTINWNSSFSPALPTTSATVNEDATTHTVGGIEVAEKQIYKSSSSYLMFNQNKGYLYNTENLGNITSVSVTYSSGCSTSAKTGVYFGTSVQSTYTSSSNTTIKGQSKTDTWTNTGSDKGYFQLSTSNKNTQITQIVISYETDPIAVTGVSLPTTAEVVKDKTITLTPTFIPSNATNQNVSWESDNDAIATVDDEGVVTGVAFGTTGITVTTEDGSYTATCSVTVTDGSIDLSETGAITFNTFNSDALGGGGYKTQDCRLTASNGKVYIWHETDGYYNSGGWQVKDGGSATSPIIKSANGFTVTVTKSDGKNVTISDGTSNAPNSLTTSKTSTTLTLSGSGGYTVISGITITPKVIPASFGEGKTMISFSNASLALDFADGDGHRPDGLKAYKVSAANSSSVTLTEVTEAVKANTGLILTGSSNSTYNIPVVNSGSDISDTNKLVATDGKSTVSDAAVLSNGKFHPLTSGIIAAGKAYLPYANITGGNPFVGGAHALDIVFDNGDVTGIEQVANSQDSWFNGQLYDLQGRKVAQPTKGLYIVNGKKVIIK